MAPEGSAGFKGAINEEIEVMFDTAGLYGIKCKSHFAMGLVMNIAAGEVSEVPEPFFEGRILKNRRHILKSRSQILTLGSNEMRLSRLMHDRLFYV